MMNDLSKLNMQELEDLLTSTREDVENIRVEINNRRLEKFNKYLHKYCKVYRGDPTLPMFIHIDGLYTRKRNNTSTDYDIHIQGNGFHGEFEAYKDMNWFDWSWWQELNINLQYLIDYQDRPENEWKIVEITKDEFMNAFNEAVSNMQTAFKLCVEADEKDEEDNETL